MDQTPVMYPFAGSQPTIHVCRKGRVFEKLNFLSNMTSLAAVLPLTNFCFCLTVQIRETLKSMDSSCTGKEIEKVPGRGGSLGWGMLSGVLMQGFFHLKTNLKTS